MRHLDLLRSQDTSESSSADRFRRRLDFDLPEPRIFHNIARETFRFVRTMTVDDAVAMLGTYSRAIVASPDERAQGLAAARAALEARFPGADVIEVPTEAAAGRGEAEPDILRHSWTRR